MVSLLHRNLMAPQDLRDLGFKDEKAQSLGTSALPNQREDDRQQKGFVAGSRT